ncbi:hypothetical protein N7472_005640 [Penicillium cf. griseofulvum]|uniref:Uncharacterized protein n=1 Tax=Penicillium cf. griseofulvum TaxID=2972120 RepID=A0A9W9JRI5_9EURO|nr:hypothetical protein N7472_005640 [Penicillium cf. griseofulvum]KAJ5431191.1 hypothetical protein N7445_008923 [Penicillium cf. griseofulvum]
MSGEGGASGIEYEDGKPNAMKRGVRNNMFRTNHDHVKCRGYMPIEVMGPECKLGSRCQDTWEGMFSVVVLFRPPELQLREVQTSEPDFLNFIPDNIYEDAQAWLRLSLPN